MQGNYEVGRGKDDHGALIYCNRWKKSRGGGCPGGGLGGVNGGLNEKSMVSRAPKYYSTVKIPMY